MSPPSPASSTRLPWRLVAPLSVAQIVSWGSLIYAFTLFIEPMGREFGWSKEALSAAYTLGLMASGLGAVPVGHWIDRGHGRLVMTGGSLLAALSLALWSQVAAYPAFLAIWIGIGFAMSATLYEPGFSVLSRSLGSSARRGITAMTLVGGFASTVFIPLTHGLIDHLGWRGALLALAGLNGSVCALIHAFVIPTDRPRRAAAVSRPALAPSNARRVLREPAFWGFVMVVVLHSALLSGFIVHLVPLLVERGFALGAVVAAFALFGPAQVGARVLVALSERRLSLRGLGLATVGLTVLAAALLPVMPPASGLIAVFFVLFGASNGMMTILRALLPPELFGPADYGAIQGVIAMPATFAKAAGPFLLAAVWSWTGATGPVLGLAVMLALASALVFALAVAPSKTRAEPASLENRSGRAAE
jgi:MFS family permease